MLQGAAGEAGAKGVVGPPGPRVRHRLEAEGKLTYRLFFIM